MLQKKRKWVKKKDATGRISDSEEWYLDPFKQSEFHSPAFCLMCTGSEKRLQDRLQTLAGNQQVGKQDMQEIAETADNLSRQKQTYKTNVDDIQSLTEDIKLQLEQARAALKIAVRHLTRAQETDVDQL